MVVRLLLLVHRVPDGVADALLHVLIRLEPDLGVPDHGGTQSPGLGPQRSAVTTATEVQRILNIQQSNPTRYMLNSLNTFLRLLAILFIMLEPSYQVIRKIFHISNNFFETIVLIDLFLFDPPSIVGYGWIPKCGWVQTFVIVAAGVIGVVSEGIYVDVHLTDYSGWL